MPSRHVLGVGSQVGARFVEGIVKLQIEVMRLQVDRRNHRGTVPGNLPKRSKMYCACNATHSLKLLAVNL
jgi:hypothetical protein